MCLKRYSIEYGDVIASSARIFKRKSTFILFHLLAAGYVMRIPQDSLLWYFINGTLCSSELLFFLVNVTEILNIGLRAYKAANEKPGMS